MPMRIYWNRWNKNNPLSAEESNIVRQLEIVVSSKFYSVTWYFQINLDEAVDIESSMLRSSAHHDGANKIWDCIFRVDSKMDPNEVRIQKIENSVFRWISFLSRNQPNLIRIISNSPFLHYKMTFVWLEDCLIRRR